MAGILFDEIIFGPIRSRRLGNSLGINLLPKENKVCTFNCVYCECGWGKANKSDAKTLLPASTIIPVLTEAFEKLHQKNEKIDSITYAGNGEPTIHPEFEYITDAIIALRNQYFPHTIITCLSNSSQLHRSDVLSALKKIDNPVMKLDTGIENTFRLINKPFIKTTLDEICDNLRLFEGNLTIQTMFLKGYLENGNYIDNTTDTEVRAWIEKLLYIQPHTVMMYPIDRETPDSNLQKIPKEVLDKIAVKVKEKGFKTLTYS